MVYKNIFTCIHTCILCFIAFLLYSIQCHSGIDKLSNSQNCILIEIYFALWLTVLRGIWYSLFLHIFIVIQHPFKYKKAWNKQKAESTNSLSTYNLIAGITFLFWLISFFMSFFTWTFTRDLQKKSHHNNSIIKSSNHAWNLPEW